MRLMHFVLMFFLLSGAGPLQTKQVAHTGMFDCTSGVQSFIWTNGTGKPIFIKGYQISMGADMGVRMDSATVFYRYPSFELLLPPKGWDHYAEPTVPSGEPVMLSPDWVQVEDGEQIIVQTICAVLNNFPGKGAMDAWIIYTIGRP